MLFALMALIVCAYDPDAADPAWKQRLQVAQQLEQAGRIEEAEKVVVQELRAAERDEPDSVRAGVILANMANLADSQGRYLQSSSLCERSMALLEKFLGPSDRATLNVLHRLANASMNLGRYAKAESLLLRVVAARERDADSDSAPLAAALGDLGLVYLAQRKPERAEPLVRRTLAIVEKDSAGHEIALASTFNTMAWVMLTSARYTEAISYAERSQALLKAVNAPAKNMIDTLVTLASLYAVTGQFGEAGICARTAIEDAKDAYGPNHFRVALALRVYGAILRRQKRNGEAKVAESRASRILARSGISLGNTIDVTALLPAGK
jgi:tetratricopeptide (TPR) repeat protein